MSESEPLFRPEVLAEHQARWLGTVLLAPRPSHRLFAAFALVATAAVLGLLFFGDYARTEHIPGWLVPEQGLVEVFPPRAGIITEIYVAEGVEVRKGDPLLALSAELQSAALGATHMEVARRLASRRDSLAEEQRHVEQLGAQQARSLSDRLGALRSEQAHLDAEIALQHSRLGLTEKAEASQRELHHDGIISDREFQQTQDARLEQEARLRDIERDRAVTERDALTLEGELQDLPIKSQAEVASLERNVAQVEQELAEAEAQREIVVPAPEAGTVTAIQVERGGRADNVPLLSIVPAGATLEAHLFCPSRAVGFLRAGQRVLLRYQAYPYQKFGHHDGVLTNVSRSAINPGELPSKLAGLTSLVATTEPVYRITARLASQTVTAYGEALRLQPGMQLDAVVVIERRRLIEWVLDPLFTLTGTWHG